MPVTNLPFLNAALSFPLRWLLVVVATLALPTLAVAQPASPPKIGKVRIGLPNGTPDGGRMRQGAWTPVYITLTADPTNGNGQQQFKVVLDALDAEENPYRYIVPVPALVAGVTEDVIGYLRAPNLEFTVSLQTADGRTIQGPLKQMRSAESEPMRPIMPLFVVMGGSSLPKLKAALQATPVKLGEVDDATLDASFAGAYARINKVSEMPDRWFGYDAADVVVLTTDNNTFMAALTAAPAAPRRKALAEWVRRGGRLVVSVGRNYQFVNNLLANMPLPEVDRMPLLPFEITGTVQRKSLLTVNKWAGFFENSVFGQRTKDGKAGPEIEVAKLALGSERLEKSGLGDGVNIIASEDPEGKEGTGLPILVQSSCGLGRVLLIAFDVDAPPFTDWGGQVAFWAKVRELMTGIKPDEVKKILNNFQERDKGELLTDSLEKYIDTFEDVPVVSFGWVALFIFLYILVVGPLDYFLLKKVLKRLELTWVTFPTVVVTISLGAYVIAYALKGDDLRVNKVDLVEIDLHTPQVYGTSWFSVFSPRMQNYTLGIEPNFQGAAGAKPSTTIAVLENPAAAARGGSTSLFRQPYEYAEDASGLEHVPIPVWSTRMFTASWRTPYLADKPPFRAELVLRKEKDHEIVTGKIINELPVDLEDVCLFYHDRWYKLPNNRVLAAGGDLFDVTELGIGEVGQGQSLESWFRDPLLAVNRKTQVNPRRRPYDYAISAAPGWNEQKKDMLFYRNNNTLTDALNSGLRSVNQSWRLSEPYRDEVILLARTPYASGRANKINEEGLVRLWNDQLPDPEKKCPELSGFLSQETYVRIYIPVKRP